MEDSKKDEGLEKKMKYVQPELISLDKGKGAEGIGQPCTTGTGNQTGCEAGGGPGGQQ